MYWRNKKLQLIICVVVCCVLLYILVPIIIRLTDEAGLNDDKPEEKSTDGETKAKVIPTTQDGEENDLGKKGGTRFLEYLLNY